MGEQDDKIFYYKLESQNKDRTEFKNKLMVKWDVLYSVLVERGVQAGALWSALIVAIWYAQRNGGLC